MPAGRQLWSRGLVDSELEALVAAFEGIARASYQKNVSIISLICNVQRTSHILERVRLTGLAACLAPVQQTLCIHEMACKRLTCSIEDIVPVAAQTKKGADVLGRSLQGQAVNSL